jgi:hypothetical protein
MCQGIHKLILQAYEFSIAFNDHSPEINLAKLDILRRRMPIYQAQVESGDDWADDSVRIKRAFVETSILSDLFYSVMGNPMLYPSSMLRDTPWWKGWVKELMKVTRALPDLLVQIMASPVPILDDTYWEELRKKVKLLDVILEVVFSWHLGGLLKDGHYVSLGKSINFEKRNYQKFTSMGVESTYDKHSDKSSGKSRSRQS